MTLDKKIAFLGGGNMAEALIKGVIAAGTAKSDQILATDISPDRLEYLQKTYGIIIQKTNLDAVREAEIALLCVKPESSTRLRLLCCEFEKLIISSPRVLIADRKLLENPALSG
jgi:pyrroline-5-carboxylate reductase